MYDQRVSFLKTDYCPTKYEVHTAFKFRKDRPMHFLQKLCCWTMKKLKAYNEEQFTHIKHTEFSVNGFMRNLFAQQSEVYKSFNIKPTRLIMGVDDFNDMMSTDVDRYLKFEASYNRDEHGRMIIQGLDVEVVPWMKGIVVLP